MHAKVITPGTAGFEPNASGCTNGNLPKTGNCYYYGHWPQNGYCEWGKLPW
ncbi:MAG: hypothetical protein HXS48_01345 [Theionarchaea archaeon]|nr:hypothetical protein [Theionarchaea archaeon]